VNGSGRKESMADYGPKLSKFEPTGLSRAVALAEYLWTKIIPQVTTTNCTIFSFYRCSLFRIYH